MKSGWPPPTTEGAITVGDMADSVRSSRDVALRTLALFSVVGVAMGADRQEVIASLLQNDLWDALAPSEMGFLDSPNPSRKQIINAGWLSERLIVLIWSLGYITDLPAGDEQCDTDLFQQHLPPFADIEVADFIARSVLRPERELIAMADEILALHWEARDAKLNAHAPRRPVNTEIVQERHHAINWITGYEGLPWDEVTSDT